VGGGGLISGLACGEQCRCRTRPCHRQRLVTRQNRPFLRARGYDAFVSRLAVSRVFRDEMAYIIATDSQTSLVTDLFPKCRLIIFSDPFYFIFVVGKNSRISDSINTAFYMQSFFTSLLLCLRLPSFLAVTVLPCLTEIRQSFNLIIIKTRSA